MTRPKPPPPPGWTQARVEGEDLLLTQWEGRIQSWARRVIAPVRQSMDVEDVAQELRMAAAQAIRRFAWEHRRLPDGDDGALLTTVIRRRVQNLNRAGRVLHRVIDDAVRSTWADDDDDEMAPRLDRVPDSTPPVDAGIEAAEMAQAHRALIYALQRDLPPAAFAILHLRYVEELAPSEIAQLVPGIGSNALASKRVGYAKMRASEVLARLGIDTVDGDPAVEVSDG